MADLTNELLESMLESLGSIEGKGHHEVSLTTDEIAALLNTPAIIRQLLAAMQREERLANAIKYATEMLQSGYGSAEYRRVAALKILTAVNQDARNEYPPPPPDEHP